LHAWVVTRYADVVTVFQRLSAERTPTPERLREMGLAQLTPLAQLMVRQMLFLDPPAHSRVRGLAAKAFTPRRVEVLRKHIQEIADSLLDVVQPTGRMDVIAQLGRPLPAIVTEELLGLPSSDREQLTRWSTDFAEVLGNFQHNPDHAQRALQCVNEMVTYLHEAVREHRTHPRDDLIGAFVAAEVEGDRLTDEEIVANTVITMVGGQETTTNLIGNGILTLLRHRDQLEKLRADDSLIASAVEELLRYESPTQQTARLAAEDIELGGKLIGKRQAVIAVIGAANRDPQRFPDPDVLDICRQDNRHVAFAWASHFCFGAPLARIEGQIVFRSVLQRMPNLRLEPGPLQWRTNLSLRGLTALHVAF
jgi:cytochrome P450